MRDAVLIAFLVVAAAARVGAQEAHQHEAGGSGR